MCFKGNNKTTCKKGWAFYSSDGTVQVRVPLKVMNDKGVRVNYNE